MALTGVSEFPNLNEAPSKVLDMALPDGWSLGTPWKADMVECEPLAHHRLAEGFEALRDAFDEQVRLFLAGRRRDRAAPVPAPLRSDEFQFIRHIDPAKPKAPGSIRLFNVPVEGAVISLWKCFFSPWR